MKVFLDTNILIDVLEQRVPYFKAAANILDLGANGKIKLYASALTFVNCIYIVRKKAGYSKVIESVRLLRDIISVSPMTQTEFDRAMAGMAPDMEDALQYQSALSSGCELIITRNKKHFPQDGMPVITAEEFFDRSDFQNVL